MALGSVALSDGGVGSAITAISVLTVIAGMFSATRVIEVDHRVTAFWRFLAVSWLCQALCAPMAGRVRLPKPWSGIASGVPAE
jgi:hypothetical protein